MMRQMSPRTSSFLIGLAMILTAGLAVAIKPAPVTLDPNNAVNLVTMVPKSFNGWRIDDAFVPIQVDKQGQALLDKIYNQTLARTYVNGDGTRVMVSISYGGNQSGDLQVHRPEVCYVAQGFTVNQTLPTALSTPFGALPVRRLVANKIGRNEPITYWLMVGNKAVQAGFEQRMQRLRFGLTGQIPDGMLVRVSSIGPDEDIAYKLQGGFINDLLAAMESKQRDRLIGNF
jgi:EpsI family protein